MFNLKDEIKKLEDSPRRDLQIIGYYLSERTPDIRTKEQLGVVIRRHLRAAKSVESFEDDQIVRSMKLAKKLVPEFTIDTILKILTK